MAAGRPAHVAFQGPTAGARRRAPQPAERPQGDRRADDAARTRGRPPPPSDKFAHAPALGARSLRPASPAGRTGAASGRRRRLGTLAATVLKRGAALDLTRHPRPPPAPPAGADDPARRLPARGALAPDRLGARAAALRRVRGRRVALRSRHGRRRDCEEGPAGASPPLGRRGHGHRQTSVLSGGSLSKVSWPARGLPHGAGGSVGWDGGSSLRHQPRHPTKRCQSLPPPCRSHAAPNDRRHYASPCSCLLHSLPPALAPGPSFPYTPTSPGTTRTLGSPICGAST